MEFLRLAEVRSRSGEIRKAFEDLLSRRCLVGRPKSKQWLFFRACLEQLLGEAGAFQEATGELRDLSATRAAQYKFEIEDRLRTFYIRDGKPLRFVFFLEHRWASLHAVEDLDDYPCFAGYRLLVRDTAGSDALGEGGGVDLPAYLESLIAEAIEAEFQAYAALPVVRTEQLLKWFSPDGPALRDIRHILERHSQRQWVITNPFNPSTKRLISARVTRLSKGEATVKTTEYWYLRWWDNKRGKYTYPYRETNRQTYVLHSDGPNWRVYANLRPAPRASIPYRRIAATG
ncbi:MAG: hypothetical protein ACE15E_21575 [Acidobacteriota bacterium]